MSKAVMTLCVVGVVAILFITELIPLAVTAMGGAITVGLLGILPVSQVFSGLSNGTVVLFAGMFVIGASMFHTGLAQRAGEAVAGWRLYQQHQAGWTACDYAGHSSVQ